MAYRIKIIGLSDKNPVYLKTLNLPDGFCYSKSENRALSVPFKWVAKFLVRYCWYAVKRDIKVEQWRYMAFIIEREEK